jgi:hypothetical protein
MPNGSPEKGPKRCNPSVGATQKISDNPMSTQTFGQWAVSTPIMTIM